MSNSDNSNTPAGSTNAIRPAQVTLNVGPTAGTDANAQAKSSWQEHRFVLIGIGMGLVLLIAVIFVLPNKVTVDVDNTPVAETVEAAPVIQGPKESPWQEQQFAKERRETQEILAKLLDKQKQLEAIQVTAWAEDEYQQAVETANQADLKYRQQEFLAAQQGYNETLAKFNELLAYSKTLYTDSLTRGEQAIIAGDNAAATEAYNLAALLKPNEAAPKDGLERAGALSQVIAEVNQGKQLQRQGNLEEAKQRYQAALALDAESDLAKQQLADVNLAIRDRNFGKQMSLGYAAINSQQYSKAIQAFEQAATIKPDAEDAKAALVQARNEKTQADIQALIQAAQQHEKNEAWQQAYEHYEKAMQLDKNLVAARVGSIRTKAYADIDTTLEDVLADQQRLATPAVYQDFTQYLAKVKAMPDPGPRLQNQIQRLEAALQKAVEPVQVQLISDSQTEVTIYRVGELGSFAQKQVTLKPGTYTVVGKRNGYRDVRKEFTVTAEAKQPAITIQCDEKIPTG